MLSLAPVALIIDFLIGYPQALQRVIGHPVNWMGKAISQFDQSVNKPAASAAKRKGWGIAMVLSLSWLVIVLGLVLHRLFFAIPFGWVGEAVIVAFLLAGRSLHHHVAEVMAALGQSLDEARAALAKIVGRDAGALDEAGVCRAAVESLAENTSDGLIAPLFWYVLAGLPGIFLYKLVSTADSMVGYRNERYADFGWASARLDDLLNFIPARLTALLYALAAKAEGADDKAALRTAWQEAKKHPSPNAGWPEAAMAGALELQLGGPVIRDGVLHEHPTFGRGKRELDAADIDAALQLYRWLCVWLVSLTLLFAWLLG